MSDSDPEAAEISYNCKVALAYAARGIPVFPCRERTSGLKKVKSPYTLRGIKNATQDEEQIRRWWIQYPDALIGLHLSAAGLMAIDGDRHDGGPDGVTAFENLAALSGYDLNVHTTVRTPANGKHWYFRAPEGGVPTDGRGSLPPGVDLKWAGYTIAAGSKLLDGRIYGRELGTPSLSTDIPIAPDWLIDVLGTAKPRAVDNQTPLCELDTPDGLCQTNVALSAAY